MDLSIIKDYLKIDFGEDDNVLTFLLEAARKYLLNAAGGTSLDETDERVKMALLVLVSDWYEHREYVGKETEKVRYTIRSIVLQLQLEQEMNDDED